MALSIRSHVFLLMIYVFAPTSLGQSEIPMFGKSSLVWVDRDGRESRLPVEAQNFASLDISPNGDYLATFITESGRRDLWTYHFGRNELRQVTFTGNAGFPVWTPDSELLIFAAWGEGLWEVPADGSSQPKKLTTPENSTHAPNTFSGDGRLIYVDISTTTIDIHLLSLDEPYNSLPLLKDERFVEYASAISPNSKWIAYMSNRTGQQEIFVSDFPSMGSFWQVSTDGGVDPRWSRNGRELFFEKSGSILAVSVETESTFEHGTPEVLFGGNYQFVPIRSYDLSDDGQRFLMSKQISP